jgi:hypothetical protein
MSLSPKRTPLTKTVIKNAVLEDLDIDNYKRIINSLKNENFLLKDSFENIKLILNPTEVGLINLCKLLYCTNHKKQIFLYLGIIIESKLNLVAEAYISNRWRSPRNFSTEIALDRRLKEFRTKFSLSEKANDISSYDLYNHFDTSDYLKNKLQAFKFLRNYGGHAKSVNEFLETIIETQADEEITDAFRLLNEMHIAYQKLLGNPPPLL